MYRIYALLSFIVVSLALGQTKPAKAQNYAIPVENWHASVVFAVNSPQTTITPRAPRITYKKRTPYNCVSTLKNAGLLPKGPVTKDGYARTIPAKPLAMVEGEKAIIKTKEGWTGHVLQVVKKDGQYISTVEGGHPAGVGRVVPESVIIGQVNL